jgi:sigma-B regulation protein RsbU (phosphoserine phosphatase)
LRLVRQFDLGAAVVSGLIAGLSLWAVALLAASGGGATTTPVGMAGGMVTGVARLIVERLRLNEHGLTQTSEVLLAAAFGVAVVFSLYLKWTRRALSNLERERIGIDTELTLAADLQRHLLPSAPATSNGFRWSARLAQAGKIGGDLYDIVGRGPGTWMVLVGDVSGKGIPAALVLASIRTMFRMLARQTGDPGEIVDRMSQTLYEENGGMPYLTCIVASIDLHDRHLAYVNAGHPCGIVLDSGHGDAPVLLESTGPPAGLFPGQQYRAKSLRLSPDAIAVLVTDGITEAFEKLGAREENSVFSVIEHLPPPLTLDRICDALIERTEGAVPGGGDESQDDRTVVTFALHE